MRLIGTLGVKIAYLHACARLVRCERTKVEEDVKYRIARRLTLYAEFFDKPFEGIVLTFARLFHEQRQLL